MVYHLLVVNAVGLPTAGHLGLVRRDAWLQLTVQLLIELALFLEIAFPKSLAILRLFLDLALILLFLWLLSLSLPLILPLFLSLVQLNLLHQLLTFFFISLKLGPRNLVLPLNIVSSKLGQCPLVCCHFSCVDVEILLLLILLTLLSVDPLLHLFVRLFFQILHFLDGLACLDLSEGPGLVGVHCVGLMLSPCFALLSHCLLMHLGLSIELSVGLLKGIVLRSGQHLLALLLGSRWLLLDILRFLFRIFGSSLGRPLRLSLAQLCLIDITLLRIVFCLFLMNLLVVLNLELLRLRNRNVVLVVMGRLALILSRLLGLGLLLLHAIK